MGLFLDLISIVGSIGKIAKHVAKEMRDGPDPSITPEQRAKADAMARKIVRDARKNIARAVRPSVKSFQRSREKYTRSP